MPDTHPSRPSSFTGEESIGQQEIHQVDGQKAPTLPTLGLGGEPSKTLTEYAPAAIGCLFWSINYHAKLAEDCREREKFGEAIAATNCVATNANKVLEKVVGKKTHMQIDITNQDSIPAWHTLPEAKRQKFLELQAMFEELPEPVQQLGELELLPHEGPLRPPQ